MLGRQASTSRYIPRLLRNTFGDGIQTSALLSRCSAQWRLARCRLFLVSDVRRFTEMLRLEHLPDTICQAGHLMSRDERFFRLCTQSILLDIAKMGDELSIGLRLTGVRLKSHHGSSDTDGVVFFDAMIRIAVKRETVWVCCPLFYLPPTFDFGRMVICLGTDLVG
jgi:hypothetical protein